MSTQPVVRQHRVFLWVLRIALFALGLNFILDSIRTGAYRELFSGPAMEEGNLLGILGGIIISGVGAGVLLMILAVLVGPVTRHPKGWVVLVLTMLGAIAPFAGFGLIFGPGGGDQNTTWGGIGFTLILLGIPLFFVAYVWAVVLGIVEIAKKRRDKRNRRTPAAHIGAP